MELWLAGFGARSTMHPVVTELINTGSELLLGKVLNTHQQWLGQRLAALGCPLGRQVTVPDDAGAIEAAVREALTRADVVITTGGLGPTSDDQTRERVAALLGRRLDKNAAVAESIRHYFESRGRAVPERTQVEALVPEGADVWLNQFGTAPGLALNLDRASLGSGPPANGALSDSVALILLPGPPRELCPMFENQAVPWLKQRLAQNEPFVCRTLRTAGLGESLVEERLMHPLQDLLSGGVQIGFCARMGEVDVRLTAHGLAAESQVLTALDRVRSLLKDHVFGEEEDTLEAVVIRELQARNRTLAVAESCTGGLLGHRLTNVPGASRVFVGGFVSYANRAKVNWLGVSPSSLERYGAVSEIVAGEMAVAARAAGESDYALSITGIAGPDGGTADKPVGTVYVGLAGPDGTQVERGFNPFDRETFKRVTTQVALLLLHRSLVAKA